MMALFEIGLVVIVFPVLVAVTCRGGAGKRILVALGTAIACLLGDAIGQEIGGPLGAVFGIALAGLLCVGFAAGSRTSSPSTTARKCPYCAETIQADAKKCRYCGEFLDRERATSA